jgi:sugar phosphate isomerase/epimerase
MIEITRRSMLAGSLVAPALSSIRLFAGEAAASTGIKVGVASYSLRTMKLPEAVKALQQLKVRYLKMKLEAHLPFTSTPADMETAKKMLADAGIQLTSTGNNPMTGTEAELRAKFEYNRKLGVPMMIIAPSHQTLPVVEKLAREYDMKVAIHNHGPEDKEFPAPADVLKAIKGMDPRVGLCLDMGHAVRAGADIVADVRAAGPRLLDVDAKDLGNRTEAKSQCDVGDGVLPVVEFFKQLKATKYAGVVHLEYEINANDPVIGMHRSLSYMHGVAAAI